MSTQELIELALLDAYGLLEQGEREAYDAAFRAAPPAVQAQVRREQTRLANMESLLPEVTPPAGLRAAVIEAVRRAMAEAGLLERDAVRHEAGRVPPLLPSRRVSPLWRAGAIGLASATLILSLTVGWLMTSIDALNRGLQNDTLWAQLQRDLGSRYVQDVLFDEDTDRIIFQRTAADFKGEASLFINPEWERARFFCKALPHAGGRAYRLAVVDENNRVVQVLATFDSSGGLEAREIQIDPAARPRLAILTTAASGQELIVSQADWTGRSL